MDARYQADFDFDAYKAKLDQAKREFQPVFEQMVQRWAEIKEQA